MRSLDVLQLRWIMLMLAAGAAVVILVLLGLYARSARAPKAADEEAAYGKLDVWYRAPRALPWFVLAIWVGIAAAMVGYLVWAVTHRGVL